MIPTSKGGVHVRSGQGRVAPMNPNDRRYNCVEGVGAVIDRIENGGDTGATADTIEAQFGSTRVPRAGTGSNPAVATPARSLEYIRGATGLPVDSTAPIVGGWAAARLRGHYALFVNDAHVVYARVMPSGNSVRAVVYDPQIARGFPTPAAYEQYLTQYNPGTMSRMEAYFLGAIGSSL